MANFVASVCVLATKFGIQRVLSAVCTERKVKMRLMNCWRGTNNVYTAKVLGIAKLYEKKGQHVEFQISAKSDTSRICLLQIFRSVVKILPEHHVRSGGSFMFPVSVLTTRPSLRSHRCRQISLKSGNAWLGHCNLRFSRWPPTAIFIFTEPDFAASWFLYLPYWDHVFKSAPKYSLKTQG